MNLEAIHPLRIIQLDAFEIDEALEKTLSNLLENSYPYSSQHKFVIDFLKFASNFYILYHNIYKSNATYGMQQLNLKFDGKMSLNKLCYPTLILMGNILTYLEFHSIFYIDRRCFQIINCVRAVCHFISLVNFVSFLNTAKYPNFLLRLLKLHIIYKTIPKKPRQIGLEYTNRELLWHSFNELISYFVPIYQSMQKQMQQFVPKKSVRLSPIGNVNCFVCNFSLNNARQLQCGHLFCYYCCENDLFVEGQGYVCSQCHTISDQCFLISYNK